MTLSGTGLAYEVYDLVAIDAIAAGEPLTGEPERDLDDVDA